MPFVYKETDCLQISSHFEAGGEHVLRNPFSLLVPPFAEHLYVFVVLMNGTKVSGGPVEGREGGGGTVCEREQP